MASMVPRWGVRGFLKWLNGQSIVGSASEPSGPASVAIETAAGYVNASRDARGWDQLRNDRFQSDNRSPWPGKTPADHANRRGNRPPMRGPWWLRRAVPERLHPAARRA